MNPIAAIRPNIRTHSLTAFGSLEEVSEIAMRWVRELDAEAIGEGPADDPEAEIEKACEREHQRHRAARCSEIALQGFAEGAERVYRRLGFLGTRTVTPSSSVPGSKR